MADEAAVLPAQTTRPVEDQKQTNSLGEVSRERYTVTMQNSQWGVATYGIIEFLRRAVVATLGISCGMVFLLGLFGIKIPTTKDYPYFILFLVTPWLFG